MARHPPGSAAAVLLSKWLGEVGADLMASLVGSESMTSSDWMLLALTNLGSGTSQKKVGETFVQRLLEKGDVHPAAAILLGLGEHNDAIEVYVSRKYYMEAILLTCLMFPTDWQRQSFLVRKWGEAAVSHGKAELAVKCFSCMGLESSEPWFSPRAQDAVFSAQKQHLLGSQVSPPVSPPGGQSRITAKMSSLKLVTDFGAGPRPQQMIPEEDEQTPMNVGVTPIAESAISPAVGKSPWLSAGVRSARDGSREPSSARTATPGSYKRRRMPSRSDGERSTTNNENLASLAVPDRGQRGEPVPKTAVDNVGREAETLPFSTRRATSAGGQKDIILTAATYDPNKSAEHLPSPAAGVFDSLLEKEAESRNSSRSRNRQELQLQVNEAVIEQGPDTGFSSNLSPPLTGASVKSAKARSIDQYISSLEEANYYARKRADSRNEPRPGSRTEPRPDNKSTRTRSRTRDPSAESRGRSGARYIRPAKRSPSSPVPMSPEDAGIYPRTSKEAATNTEHFDDERYYKVGVASPVATESVGSSRTNRSRAKAGMNKPRSSSKTARRPESPEAVSRARSRGASRASSRRQAEDRGRSTTRDENSARRSPGSPKPMFLEEAVIEENYEPIRPRQRSSSRRAGDRGTSARREQSPDRRQPRDRSISRKAAGALRESSRSRVNLREASPERLPERVPENRPESRQSNISGRSGHLSRPTTLSRKELAAKELEERRLSLARRPSAPVIPHPGELAHRPVAERSHTDGLELITMHRDPVQRSQTADPEISKKYSPTNRIPVGATSTSSVPIGLPATPRAMRHPRYMSADPNEREGIPAVPTIPDNLIMLETQQVAQADGPLLPATTFGQAPPARSASAPPEDVSPVNIAPRISPTLPQPTRRGSLGGNRGHLRMNTSPDLSVGPDHKRVSPPPITASIDETIHENQVVILEQDPNAPTLVAELQHLATPPPPPPAPASSNPNSPKSSVGLINIAIEEKPQDAASPVAGPSATSSPINTHRRGRGSVSENIGMTFKRVTERMRSTSRSRNKSPPVQAGPSPYESVPEFTFPRSASARSPVDNRGTEYLGKLSPPPPPPTQPMEQAISPIDELRNSQFQGYRHPKEIRANMPPQQLQPGVYHETPMI